MLEQVQGGIPFDIIRIDKEIEKINKALNNPQTPESEKPQLYMWIEDLNRKKEEIRNKKPFKM